MLEKRVKGVCLVFELAYDAHIPKDVILVPLELAKLLGDYPTCLKKRPKVYQEKLSKCIDVIYTQF